MTDRMQNLLTGFFVLAGIVCLGTLIILFGEARGLFGEEYTLKARFDRIAGVREGTDVNLAGLRAGSVARIELIDAADPGKGVYIVMNIERKYIVPKGSTATVFTPLLGQATVNINPAPGGGAPLPQDGEAVITGMLKNPLEQVIDPKLLASLEDTVTQIKGLAEALTPAARAVENLLQQRTIKEVEASQGTPEEIPANLYTAVERLHNVLTHVDTVLGDAQVQSNVKATFANLQAASEEAKVAVAGFRAFSEEAQKTAAAATGVVTKLDATVDTTHQHIDMLGRKLLDNSDRLSRVLDHLVSAGQDLAEGEGTMGMLLRDPKFYDELMLTTKRLGEAALELQVLIKQWQKQGLLSVAK